MSLVLLGTLLFLQGVISRNVNTTVLFYDDVYTFNSELDMTPVVSIISMIDQELQTLTEEINKMGNGSENQDYLKLFRDSTAFRFSNIMEELEHLGLKVKHKRRYTQDEPSSIIDLGWFGEKLGLGSTRTYNINKERTMSNRLQIRKNAATFHRTMGVLQKNFDSLRTFLQKNEGREKKFAYYTTHHIRTTDILAHTEKLLFSLGEILMKNDMKQPSRHAFSQIGICKTLDSQVKNLSFPLYTCSNISLLYTQPIVTTTFDQLKVSQTLSVPIIKRSNSCTSRSGTTNCPGDLTVDFDTASCPKSGNKVICRARPCLYDKNIFSSCTGTNETFYILSSTEPKEVACTVLDAQRQVSTMFRTKNTTFVNLPHDHSMNCEGARIDRVAPPVLLKEVKTKLRVLLNETMDIKMILSPDIDLAWEDLDLNNVQDKESSYKDQTQDYSNLHTLAYYLHSPILGTLVVIHIAMIVYIIYRKFSKSE